MSSSKQQTYRAFRPSNGASLHYMFGYACHRLAWRWGPDRGARKLPVVSP